MNEKLPPIILGGDPFSNQFRYLYRKDRWWKLHDPDYCLSVMHGAYDAGCRAFDLSFQENVHLFNALSSSVDEPLLGFGNPTWQQGVMFEDRFIFFIRDRILRTLVERVWPPEVASRVDETLSHEDVLVFGYDRSANLLAESEITEIYLDEQIFRQRISIFKNVCQYLYFGGSDADYVVSLGRLDLIQKMLDVVRSEGFIPFLLCQFPSLVLPRINDAGIDVDGFVIPLNKAWSWIDLKDTLRAVRNADKPIIAFMALSSPELKKDIAGALSWLYNTAGIDSILFGTASPEHARQTTEIALTIKNHQDLDNKKMDD